MILDNEEQRQVILGAIETNTITGTYDQVKEIFPKIEAVVEAVKAAKIKEKDGPTKQ